MSHDVPLLQGAQGEAPPERSHTFSRHYSADIAGYAVQGRTVEDLRGSDAEAYRSCFRPGIFLRELAVQTFYPLSVPVAWWWLGAAFVRNRNLHRTVLPSLTLLLLGVVIPLELAACTGAEVRESLNVGAWLVLVQWAVHNAFVAVKYAYLEPVHRRRFDGERLSPAGRAAFNIRHWLRPPTELLLGELAATALEMKTAVSRDDFGFDVQGAPGLYAALLPPSQADFVAQVDVASAASLGAVDRVSGWACVLAIARHCQPPRAAAARGVRVARAVACGGLLAAYGWRLGAGQGTAVMSHDGHGPVAWDLVAYNLLWAGTAAAYNSTIFAYLDAAAASVAWRSRCLDYVDAMLSPAQALARSDEFAAPVVHARPALLRIEASPDNVKAWMTLRLMLTRFGPSFSNRVGAQVGLGVALVVLSSAMYVVAAVAGVDDTVSGDFGYAIFVSTSLLATGFYVGRAIVFAARVNSSGEVQRLLTEQALDTMCARDSPEARRAARVADRVVRVIELENDRHPLRLCGVRADDALISTIAAVVVSGLATVVQDLVSAG